MGRASLKPAGAPSGTGGASSISRPYGPGLIEASIGRKLPLGPPRFPGPMGRASLKPLYCTALAHRRHGFPGPMGRASLKQDPTLNDPASCRRFPGPMGRASLKRQTATGKRQKRKEISRPYGPGLIEAIPSRLPVPSPESISRPYGPGLIEAPCPRSRARRHYGDFPALWAGPH